MKNTPTLFAATLLIACSIVSNAHDMTGKQALLLYQSASQGNMQDKTKLELSAKSGNPKAQLFLGVYYSAEKDINKSVYWIE